MADSEFAYQRKPSIVILDFGSQYSELIARRVRETEVYSLVMSYNTSVQELRELAPKGIILSGGPNSVYSEGAPICDEEIWSLGTGIEGDASAPSGTSPLAGRGSTA